MGKIINNLFQLIYLRITHANGTGSHGAKFPLGQPVKEMPVLKLLLIMCYQGLEFSRGRNNVPCDRGRHVQVPGDFLFL